jgi:SAM-dependent methyltransferase
MMKYLAVAFSLKAFSSTAMTRRVYREIGNRRGGKRRATGGLPFYYPERVKRMLRLVKEHGIVRDGDYVLELGTGWLHWEALTLRLFFDIRAVLFDVWDNRQLDGLKNYVSQLRTLLANQVEFPLEKGQIKRADALISDILRVNSFSELYKMLGFEYVIESSGSLSQFSDDSFNLVVSAGVLEHVSRSAVPMLIRETSRVLVPGGYASHSIDTSDHLAHYDTAVNKKAFLRFSEPVWKALFQNEVQYINRIPYTEWMDIFRSNSFEILEEVRANVDIAGLPLASQYRNFDPRDLECTYIKLLLRKPELRRSGGVAQSLERCPVTAEVAGVNPAAPATFTRM